MIELGIALLLHTQPLQLKPRPQVAIVLGESDAQIRERQEQESIKKPRRIVSKQVSTQSSDIILVREDSTNNCVRWAQNQTGISHPIGNGGRSGVQGTEPKVGAIGVQRSIVHAVLIIAVNGDQITIQESNFKKGWITQRVLNINEFIGFIYG